MSTSVLSASALRSARSSVLGWLSPVLRSRPVERNLDAGKGPPGRAAENLPGFESGGRKDCRCVQRPRYWPEIVCSADVSLLRTQRDRNSARVRHKWRAYDFDPVEVEVEDMGLVVEPQQVALGEAETADEVRLPCGRCQV